MLHETGSSWRQVERERERERERKGEERKEVINISHSPSQVLIGGSWTTLLRHLRAKKLQHLNNVVICVNYS